MNTTDTAHYVVLAGYRTGYHVIDRVTGTKGPRIKTLVAAKAKADSLNAA